LAFNENPSTDFTDFTDYFCVICVICGWNESDFLLYSRAE
jgi:hypothetical protein